MNIIFNIISFVIVIAVCVIVHEYGHYITAKILGVQVHEFAFGMGPALFQKRKNNMLWSIRALPIGGFCRLAGMGEDEEDEIVIPGKGFNEQSAWKRFLILLNGSLFNIILAVILMAMFLWGHGVLNMESTKIGELMQGLPSEQAGLKIGDEIIKINDTEVKKWREMQETLQTEAKKSENLILEVKRDNEILNINITVPLNQEYGRYMLGISPSYERYGFLKAISNAGSFTYRMTVMMIRGIADWVMQRQEVDVTGPIGIASMSGRAMSSGFWSFITFISLIALNLGLLNLFPIPALDGGRILFVLLEMILRRRLPEKVENWIHTAGFVLLITLMIFVTCQDVYKIFMTH